MLQLPKDWKRAIGGWIALQLLRQISSDELRAEFSRCLIRASLHLAVVTFFGRRGPSEKVVKTSVGWRIGGLKYVFLPRVDDDVLQSFAELVPGCDDGTFVIVPSNHEILLGNALKTCLPESRQNVRDFDSFICWRTAFASLDAGWSRERVMLYLLHDYNRRVIASGTDQSILIRLPKSAQKYCRMRSPKLSGRGSWRR